MGSKADVCFFEENENVKNEIFSYRVKDMVIILNKKSENRAGKRNLSYPVRFGRYCEIRTLKYIFHFNMLGEITFIRGFDNKWPHPLSWLKRTDGNDWVFYLVQSQSKEKNIFNCTGEYYLPCLSYSNNGLLGFNPYFSGVNIMQAVAAWAQLYSEIFQLDLNFLPSEIALFLKRIIKNDDSFLFNRSKELKTIIKENVSVLPPDTRHVDYEVIPLNIMQGCLYKCDFCCVKSKEKFRVKSMEEITFQINRLKAFYGENIDWYNGLFLGNHDGLASGRKIVCESAEHAFKAFDFGKRNNTAAPGLFMFCSADSLLKADRDFLREINDLPYYTYLNVGFESLDDETLKKFGKPLDVFKLLKVFEKVSEINNEFSNIEISVNFVIGDNLSKSHFESLAQFLSSESMLSMKKGNIYISPLIDNLKKEELFYSFMKLKKISIAPVFLYLIQRL